MLIYYPLRFYYNPLFIILYIYQNIFNQSLVISHQSLFIFKPMPQQKSPGFPLQDYYSHIYKKYDLINHLFTFWQDKKWRRKTVEACLSCNPQRVLDLCCGTGDLAIGICLAGNNTIRLTGYDLNLHMLGVARIKANQQNARSVEFIQGDVLSMPFAENEFDCITIGFGFRNLTYENPNREFYLREINRVMKPGSRLIILESSFPENNLIKQFYRLYLKLVLVPLGNILSGHRQAYRYLAGSSAGYYTFSELDNMLEPYGLKLNLQQRYLFGSVNILIALKKGT
jgi:demethylmenaquinone methyltransferase/2-methoxy-6-polyprenyl-1,4-benzoquinol methylase